MTLIVPNAREVEILTTMLTPALELRLYGNNITPSGTDSIITYNQISGGGYAALPLTFVNWTISGGSPSLGLYPVQQWTFTGAIATPFTIYGYYVVDVALSTLKWAERFPAGNVPFTPIAGSIIRVVPRITVESA